MKNVITGTACMILLFAVFLQFIHVQTMVYDMHEVMGAAESFREQVRLDGCITDENERRLKREVSDRTEVSTGEVRVSGTRVPVPRGGKVHYVIRVPLGRFVLAPSFFRLQKDSRVWYREDRWAASEAILYSGGGVQDE